MHKNNTLSLSAALGMMLCSLNAQAMKEEEDERIFNAKIMQKEDWLKYLKKEDLENFFLQTYVIADERNATPTREVICRYNSIWCAIDVVTRNNFVCYYDKNIAPEKTSLEIVYCRPSTCTYKYWKRTHKPYYFSLSLVKDAYVRKQASYTIACFNALTEIKIGEHPIDFYLTHEDYINSKKWKEWNLNALTSDEYEVYNRRIDYQSESGERKTNMENETRYVRDQLRDFMTPTLTSY